MRTWMRPPRSDWRRKPSSQMMYLSNISLLPDSAEQPLEHDVLAAYLLDAVDRVGVLNVPVALVLAGQVAVIAALDQDRDDLVVRDAVLGAVLGHLVELGLDVPDARHVVEHVLRVGPGEVGGLPGQAYLDRSAAHVVDRVHEAVRVAVVVIGGDDQVNEIGPGTLSKR